MQPMSPIRPLSAALLVTVLFACAGPDELAIQSADEALTLGEAKNAVLTPITIDPGLIKLNPGVGKLRPKAAPACSNTALWTSPSSTVGCPGAGKMSGGSWTARSVFSREGTPSDLARVCAYDWTPDANTPDAPPDLDKLGSLLSQWPAQPPELDCPVVSGMSGGADPVLDAALWRAMRDTALTQVNRPPFIARSKTRVQVAVVDTAALPFDEPTLADTYGHGRLVGRLIEDLTCGEGGQRKGRCLSDIRNYLAMPWLDSNTRNDTLGGYMGRREDLVQAIEHAISDYLAALTKSTATPRLALVIAAGWDPAHGGDIKSPQELSPASFAVYSVLARAACLGVATLAAAGNVHGRSDSGPLLPAAWETLPTPNAEQCSRYIGFPGDKIVAGRGLATSANGQTSLLYAFSAVDEQDHVLATARKGSEPRMVAYGLSMVTDDTRAGDDHTNILTGTSFGPAVAGAALAAAWAYLPRLPPHKIIQLIHDAGMPTGDTAELCFNGLCDAVTRISVCEAMRKSMCSAGLCGEAPASCEVVPANAGKAPDPHLFERPFDTLLSGVTTSDPLSAPPVPGVSEDPWIYPQPESAPCKRCAVQMSSNEVIIELSAKALAETTDLTVVTGSTATRVLPPVAGAPYPSSLRVPVPTVAPGTRAAIVRTVSPSGVPAAYSADDIDVL
jgi:hypothetical protein